MKRYLSACLLFSLVAVCAATVVAQASGTNTPPKVLVVTREFVKPGKSGGPHMKTESLFVQAMTAAKWPTHYLGTDALTGPVRAVFFIGYDSLDAWGKDTAAQFASPTLGPALDKAYIADGDLLSAVETNVFVYREDLSYHAGSDIPHMRYFEATVFRAKPGHEMEWEDVAKMYVKDFGKAFPDAHWATYQAQYGHDSGSVYVVITPMKTLAEADAEMAGGNKFMEQLGESGMKKLMDLEAAGTASWESNILSFNPAMSYVSDDWVKADPTFWKPKAATAPAKKPAQ